MKICDDLRQAVLQAAIQGKLTTQRKEDGDARELLKRIAAEKAKLIKEKKIKKEKPLPEITEEEIPFEVPENWVWVRLGEIVSVFGGKRIPAGRRLSESITPYKYIRVSDMKNGTVSTENIMYVPVDIFPKIKNYIITSDDLYITVAGTIGKTGFIPNELSGANLTENADRLKIYKELNKAWLKKALDSIIVQNQISEVTTKVGQPKLAILRIQNLIIPLPPLAEQHRIVAKVDKLMAEIDELEKVENELHELKTAFPGDIKAALLQAAMQGKLTTQRKEDGDARDLLKQIAKEKAQLIKEKKIKKEKPLPEITEDEIPFDVPENWVWCRLGEIGAWGSGATPSKSNSDYYNNATIPWLLTGDLNNGIINDIPNKISEKALKETSVRLNPIGSVLIAMYGATIGKLGILGIEATTNQACCACYPMKKLYNKYLFYFLMECKPRFVNRGEGGAQPNISKEKIVATTIPLPPLAEQYRIVAKLEKLLPLCDGLVEE